jgi:hypothetical protein
LATQGKRLYYSVAKPLQIWSVGLNSDGSFANDSRAEIDVAGTPFGNLITGILFDGPDKLYLSQRGELAGSYDYGVFAKIDTPIVRHYAWNDTTKRRSEDADELAIGLKPPYRSTDGGIALNYGYGPDGTIDYGKCRQTLWTTGEHLREGEDAARVSPGGARSIKGLQGTSKGNFLPANAPPHLGLRARRPTAGASAACRGHRHRRELRLGAGRSARGAEQHRDQEDRTLWCQVREVAG